MTENEDYVAQCIRRHVHAGFHDQGDIERMIEDIAEEDCDIAELKSLVGPSLRLKLREERGWPAVTDCDRLDAVFHTLHGAGICALANAGYTMSDGYSDVAEVVAAAPADTYRGYCFYHGQDVERAIEGGGIMLAFGDMGDDEQASLLIGREIVEALRAAGFAVEWNESVDTRIKLPVFDWKRRAAGRDVPTCGVMVDRWYAGRT